MEASEPVPVAGEAARDLAGLVLDDGPFLTVLLTTDPTVENARQRSELRWKVLRSDLAARGVPDHVLSVVDPVVPEAHLGDRTLTVLANASGARHVEHGDDPDDPDDHADGVWETLPWLFPILSWRQVQVPHVVALIDRRGADLYGVRRETSDVHREVDSEGEPMARSAPGGWSQRRFQQRAENSWEQGAGDVAKELLRLVDRVEPRLVVVAGDVRAVQFLREALPDDVNDLVRHIEGERPNADGSGGMPDQVPTLVSEIAQRETDEVLARFEQELGQGDQAVDGAAATIGALSKAQVEILVIRDDRDDERRAWFGPAPTHVGLSREALGAMGVDRPRDGRLRDVLVRAALATSARIRIPPAGRGPREGIGAILRWAD